MITSLIAISTLFSGAHAYLQDVNGVVLTNVLYDSVDIFWNRISKKDVSRIIRGVSDSRFNGVGFESTGQCYATLVKTWTDVNGTVPASVIDQPAVAVTVITC